MTPKTSTMAIKGAKWVAIGTLFQRLLRMLLIVLLARLLTPDDFGLIAAASLVLVLAGRIKQLGFHGALLQRRDHLEEAANAYFFFNSGLVILTCAAILAASRLATWFFGDDRVVAVINVMAIKLLAEAAYAVQKSLTAREMNFKRLTYVQLAETVVFAVIAISLAVMGFGVWSMVWGMIAGAIFAAMTWWVSTPWHPTRAWSPTVAREMFRFGVDLWSISNLSYLTESASRFFTGRFLGVVPLGYFEFTNRVIQGPTGALVETSNRVALPAYCREQEDLNQMGHWFLKVTGYISLVTAPLAAMLIVLGDHIVPVIFGPQWLSTIPLLRVLAPFVFMNPLLYAWPVFVSTGRTTLLMRFTVLRLVITVPLIWFAARQSLFAVCAVESLTACLLAPVNLYLVTRVVAIRIPDILVKVGLPLLGGGVFALVVLATRFLSGSSFPEPSPTSLAVFLLPAGLVYLGVIVLIQPRLISEFRTMFLIAIGRRIEVDHD